ncbi:ATP-binding cassette domain-containing protein [Alginatibacterium sediminis]|uniref:ATP-binding cassette domain-containing protein n=1 Tax=Alginatibacterium sediminis TaxID=2164068 RepID=A0A420E6M8_9ALTE|nr:ATP-binding cassette domain-containing protein [Alginatibacterium sediminis]RKF13291.1 ATP-binding cassette domain-containing protein [Alginatibacterium sediminis]
MLHKLSAITSLLLVTIHALSGLALLLFSAWFIAACAIAGTVPVVGFNYLLPATFIRALALTRIGSGYAEKLLGHHVILSALGRIRLMVLQAVFFAKDNSKYQRAQQSEQLESHAQAMAYVWITAVHPYVSALLTLTASVVILSILLGAYSVYWIGYAVLVLAIFFAFSQAIIASVKRRDSAREAFKFESEHWLREAPLWDLQGSKNASESTRASYQRWHKANQAIESNIFYCQQSLVLLSLCGMWLFVANLNPNGIGQGLERALILVPLLWLLASRDWMAQAIRALPALREYQLAKQPMQELDLQRNPVLPGRVDKVPLLSNKLNLDLSAFNPQRGSRYILDSAVTVSLHGPQLLLLRGGSGCGKSSVLEALAGLTSYSGSAIFADLSVREYPDQLRRQYIHYVQQAPQLLSANLRDNLTLADCDASDQMLLDALQWAGLETLASIEALNQWIGEKGRSLSGGELKRIALCRAKLFKAPLILIDEPFEGLDSERQQQLSLKLNQLSQKSIIILASHIQPSKLQVTQVLDLSD